MVVPDDTSFPIHVYEDAGYQVVLFPPVRSDLPLRADVPDKIDLDDKAAFVADTLRIDFHKETFDRGEASALDPPEVVIRRAIDSFLTRLRYVTRGFQVSPIEFPKADWQLRYLNDKEEELEQVKGLIRRRGAHGRSFSLVAVTPEIWNHIHALPVDWLAPRWHDLLLDASGALPKVGTALVLAATALEVFIVDVLDGLASQSALAASLWKWLNHRGDWQKDPSTEEQFDFLLAHFTGHSLKEDQALWAAFKNIRTARNSFVHEGAPRLGGKLVTLPEATQFVGKAREIIEWVRQWLPAGLQWPHIVPSTRMRIKMRML